MIFDTLRDLFKYKNIKIANVARSSGFSRQTVHTSLDNVPDHVSVRALRAMAATVGAQVVIRFGLPDEEN